MTMDSDVVETYVCEGCGKLVKVMKAKMMFGPQKGEVVESKIGCDCELIEKAQQAIKIAKANKLKDVFEENSLINPSLRNATFENFIPGEFHAALISAQRYAKAFNPDTPRNLLFQGQFGTGKSHLSVAIAKEVMKKGYTAIFTSTPKLLTKIRNTYSKTTDVTEDQLLNLLATADLVVFDDIGAEGDITGWGMQKLFEVIDQRMGKCNIFTTNLSSAELKQSKDMHRIFSRMLMNTETIIMNGPDYRRKQFEKEMKASG